MLNFARLDTGRIKAVVLIFQPHQISFNSFSDSFSLVIGNRLAKYGLLSDLLFNSPYSADLYTIDHVLIL